MVTVWGSSKVCLISNGYNPSFTCSDHTATSPAVSLQSHSVWECLSCAWMSIDDVEHTLFVCRQVNLYRVPPKATAGGHKSGEWKVADKIFAGRLKVTASGDAAEVRLEDSDRCPPESDLSDHHRVFD